MSVDTLRNGAVEAAKILKQAARAWSKDNGPRMAAALAFYAAFSIAPLLLLAMGVAGFLFDEQFVRAELAAHLHEFVGPRIEEFVWDVVDRWQDRGAGLRATVAAFIALGWGAFRGFDAVRSTLNMIWGVEKRSGAGLFERVLRRTGTFIVMLCAGGLIIASLVFSTIVTHLARHLDATDWVALPAFHRLETVGTMILVAVMFAMIFKWAANVEIDWRDAACGAAFTAVVFAVGKYLVELVLTHVATISVFGAAGALVALLMWVYLSAMIFFFGAEVTKVWADHRGRQIRPDSTAIRVDRLETVREAIRDALGDEAVDKVDRELGIGD